MSEAQKVFGIGFHKTGTSSLFVALSILGYKAVHGGSRNVPHGGTGGKKLLDEYIEKGNYYLPTFEVYDAFTDNPYFSIWKELVKMFPDSKYILTVRDENKWIKSCAQYYKGRRVRPMRDWMFGQYADPSKNKESKMVWLAAYRRHNAEIVKYFKSTGEDLLIMDISTGDGWNVLCPFLGKPIPSDPFPHQNKSTKPLYKRLRSLVSENVARIIGTYRK